MRKIYTLLSLALLLFATAASADVAFKGKYVKVTSFDGAGVYIMAAGDQAFAQLDASKTYGYMPVKTLNIKDDAILASETTDAVRLTFSAVEGGYSMVDASGRYIAMAGNYNSYNLYSEAKESYVWTVTPNADGTFSVVNAEKGKTIWLSKQYGSWGCYPSKTDDYSYPCIYKYVAGDEYEGGGGNDTPDPTTMTVGKLVSDKFTDPAKIVNATVVATYGRGFLVDDGTGRVLVYQNAAPTQAVGDVVTITGSATAYAGMLQFTAAATIEKTGTKSVTEPQMEFTERDMDDLLNTDIIKYGQYTGTLTISGNYYNVTIPDCQAAVGSISYPADGLVDASWNEKEVTVTGYFIGTSSNKYFNTMVTKITCEGGDVPPGPEIGDGTKEEPLTVAELQKHAINAANVWVKGYIVGSANGSLSKTEFGASDAAVATNLILADAADCTDINACIPVQLPTGEVRAALNLLDNPGNLGKLVTLYGTAEKYFSVAGLKNVTEYYFEGGGDDVDPRGEPDPDNIYTSSEVMLRFWYADANWNEIGTPKVEPVGGPFKDVNITVPDNIGGQEWMGQNQFRIEHSATPEKLYMFSLNVLADKDFVMTIKLACLNDDNDNFFFYDNNVVVKAGEKTAYVKNDITPNKEFGGIALFIDLGRAPGGTLVKISDITIKETGTNNVANILSESNAPVWYDLTGKRLNAPQKGINIMQAGGKAVKVIIR